MVQKTCQSRFSVLFESHPKNILDNAKNKPCCKGNLAART